MIGPLSYVGGKNRFAKIILPLIPPHRTYCEPFFGGGQIFFRKPPSEIEIINDLSRDVINFFRVCQNHHEELVRYLKYTLVSREWFKLYKLQDPETLTDVQRAARFFFLQKNSYGGIVANRNYKITIESLPNYNPERIPEVIEETRKRLQRVQIECLPYQRILEKADRAETFFFLDPPYWGKKNLYEFDFTENDFAEFREMLGRLKGKFLLTLNDLPPVRDLFSGFHQKPISLSYSAANLPGRRYAELLISNYKI